MAFGCPAGPAGPVRAVAWPHVLAPTAPATQLAQSALPSQAVPNLTAGLPDPEAVERQKQGYIRTLDEQLRQGSEMLDEQLREHREEIQAQAEQRKERYNAQVENQVRLHEMEVDQQYNEQLMKLKQQASRQRAVLEQQALQLSYEYQDRRAEEDMLASQAALRQEQQALRHRLAQNAAKALDCAQLPPELSPVSFAASAPTCGTPAPVGSLQGFLPRRVNVTGFASPNSYAPAVPSQAVLNLH